jgi:cell division protein FtsA
MKKHIVAALDIGTSFTKVLVATRKEKSKAAADSGEASEIEILSQVSEPSFGVRKGVVFNADSVSEICRLSLKKAEEEAGYKIESVYASINGAHIFSVLSKGLVSVSRADRKIPQEDVDRVLQAAIAASMTPQNKEIIKTQPLDFIVDGQGGLKDVVGMDGVRLEANVMSVGVFSPYLNNLTKAVLDSGVQINDVLPSIMASAKAVLKKKEKELGVALLEIGAGTTGLAVYREGELVYAAVLPIGSLHITNDIAAGLKTDPDLAEKIKLEFGSCIKMGKDKKEKMEMDEGEFLTFSHRQLSTIISSRVSEIFGEVNKELKRIQKEVEIPSGVVITGGGAKLPKILELAKKELKTYCRMGRPLCGTDDISMVTACGLILNGFELENGEGGSSGGIDLSLMNGMGGRLKKIFRSFLP